MNVLPDRLREAMELRGVDQTALAKGVGVTQGAISLILKGKTRKSKHLPDIAVFLKVPLAWLQGLIAERQHPLGKDAPLTDEERALIDDLRMLSEQSRRSISDIVSALVVVNMIDSGVIEVGTRNLKETHDFADRMLVELAQRQAERAASGSDTVHAGSAATVHEPGKGFDAEE